MKFSLIKNKKYLTVVLLAVGLFAVFLGGFLIGRQNFFKFSQSFSKEEVLLGKKNYKFELLSPDASKYSKLLIASSPLKDILENEIKKYPQFAIGIYFESLQSGAWVGLNEKEEFYPASLLKIPIAMTFLKKVEEGAYSLDQTPIIKEEDLDCGYGTWCKEKKAGDMVSFREVLQAMLNRSDNTASDIFSRYISAKEYNDTFEYLVLTAPEGEVAHLSLKKYATIFRTLYYASYLNEENSSLILSLLIDSDREDLIPAGLSKEIVVAHKFGIAKKEQILTDCGIVYLDQYRYFLCVSAEGDEVMDRGNEVISGVSKSIFDFYINRDSNF